ncbi:MAG: hypothetical protein KatS3mg081_2704 [Gemmatimonadales bacterium]|nr:MAG: hypothetical protein KatS3mg081_2704 [Gemmatimonadales bacterium]
MTSTWIRFGVIATGVVLWTTPGASPASGQEPFWQVSITLSRWSLASETATTVAASAWVVGVDAARWRGPRAIGARLLVSPGISGSIPPLLGLQMQAALRSSSRAQLAWRPVSDARIGFGALNFSDHVSYLVSVCDYSGQCRGDPDFRPGWIPFVSVSGGLDTRLPLSAGLRAEAAADIPIRSRDSPGGGRFAYVRLGLGLWLRP